MDDQDAAGGLSPDIESQAVRRRLLAGLAGLFGDLDEQALADLEQQADWVSLRRGEPLMRQGDAGDGLYVLLAGRLRVVHEGEGGPRVIGEAAAGEAVGEMSFFTGSPRSASVYAIRDSLLVRFSNQAFEAVTARHPQVLRQVIRLQIERLQRANRGQAAVTPLTNVAVVALSPGAKSSGFARRLAAALSTVGTTLHIDRERVERELGIPGITEAPRDSAHGHALLAWLSEQEARHRFVLYEADATVTDWTRRCAEQADRILLVAESKDDPRVRDIEQGVASGGSDITSARRTLVLLHPDGNTLPSGTRAWLEARPVENHYHVRLDRDEDFGRVARLLGGVGVGLVLGGGGARGFAHIGLIRALVEAGVPIDVVGGTSMGSGIAAQFALGWSWERILEINRLVWMKIRPHKEYTLPLMSVVRGKSSAACGRMMYGDTQIEDLWVPFFCVASDLTDAKMMVFRSGSLLTAVTASSSLPGIAVPVMDSTHLFVDGALFNNLPGDVIRALSCGRTIVSKVSVDCDDAFVYQRVPSLAEVLRTKLTRRRDPLRYPALAEVVLRSAMLSSIGREQAIAREADFLFEPPLKQFGLMQFPALDEIVTAAYAFAKERIEGWKQQGSLTLLKGTAAVASQAG